MYRSSIARLITTVAAAVAVVLTTQGITGRDVVPAGPESSRPHWVNTWTSMPQLTEPGNLPPAPFTQPDRVMDDSTLRQTIRISVGGRQLRLRFSNAFGTTALPITAASFALPVGGQAGVSAIQPGTARPVTFQGRSSATVPIGAQIVSDPVDVDVAPRSNLTVTLYLATGQTSNNITSHPGSRTTSYLVKGNQVDATDLPSATPVNHWYFLSGAETIASRGTAGVVMLGDSLTDGRGSTTNQNNRWPDQLLDRLQTRPQTADVAILNQAAGGNRVLANGLGPNVLSRVDRDVLAQTQVDWLVVFVGINDIGSAATTEAGRQKVVDELTAAYEQIVVRAHAHDLKVYGATLLPFGGSGYDDAGGHHEAARQAVNEWIRTSGQFDAVLDFETAVQDPANPRMLLPAFDDGDHLHLSPAGYKALADAVPAWLFH